MKHNKNQGNRWKKIMALLLSAAMLAPAAPGTAYASENPNEDQILEYRVLEDAEREAPVDSADEGNEGNEGNEENEDGEENGHTHIWDYQKVLDNGQEIITASGCQISGCSLSGNQVRLTMQVNPGAESPVTVSKDGVDLPNEWGIKYEIKYCKANPAGETQEEWKEEYPTEPGEYKVRAIFGGDETNYLEKDYVIHGHIWKYTGTANTVKAVCEGKGVCEEGAEVELTLTVKKKSVYESNPKTNRAVFSAKNKNGALSPDALGKLGISAKLTYYKDNKGKPGSSLGSQEPKNAGTYHAQLTVGDTTIKDTFTISKEKRKVIEVIMASYDLKQEKKPQPGLSQEVEKSLKSKIKYYYSRKKANKNGSQWNSKKANNIKTDKVKYYMYAVVPATANYEAYTTNPKEFTVYPDHQWTSIRSKPDKKKEKNITATCSVCKATTTVTLPKSTVSVNVGRTKKLVSKNKGCTFTTKVKEKYFELNSKKGTIKIKPNPEYYSSVKEKIPVTVEAGGQTYEMTVKVNLKLPKLKENDIKVSCSNVTVGGVAGKKFVFQYKIPSATKMTVRIEDKKGQTAAINSYFDKYFSNPRPAGTPFINLSDSLLADMGNKVTFVITVSYGKNKFEPLKKTIALT